MKGICYLFYLIYNFRLIQKYKLVAKGMQICSAAYPTSFQLLQGKRHIIRAEGVNQSPPTSAEVKN
jgi:hypothetical protein